MDLIKKFSDYPWTFDGTVIRCADNNIWFCEDRSLEEIEYNAHLAAAAPELLEALEWAVQNIRSDASVFGLNKCFDSIRKAYGVNPDAKTEDNKKNVTWNANF